MNIQFNRSTAQVKTSSVVILILVTIVTLLGGIWFFKHDAKLKKECTYKTTAVVSDIKKSSSSDDDTYAPVYTYEYEGKEYTVSSNVYSSKLKMHEGDTVEFYLKPSDPKTYYCPKETSGKFFCIILLIVSGLCLICTGFSIKSLINSKRYDSGY